MSKWGYGSLMQHAKDYCPFAVPSNTIEYYTLSPPPKPGSISGPSTHCVNETESYWISAVKSAESNQWDITSPGSIVGSGSNLTVNITSSSTGTSYLKVRAANGAGYGPWSDPRTINFVSSPATPGTIYSEYPPWIGHCVGETEEYWISSVSGATSYVWEASGSLSIDSQSGTSADVYASNTNSGTLRVKACNSYGCSGWCYSSPNPIYPVDCEGGWGFSMSPNPADNLLELAIEKDGKNITL